MFLRSLEMGGGGRASYLVMILVEKNMGLSIEIPKIQRRLSEEYKNQTDLS